jgi:hypothetical protein
VDSTATIYKDRPVTLAEWLEGRTPNHLSTNAGTPLVAFQAWRSFKEAFAPELIAQAFEETSNALGRKVRRSIDPFGGSGTTALASQFLGADPTTVEVNPYLADLIEAKLTSYDVEVLLDDYNKLLTSIRDFEGMDIFPGAPDTFVEPGRNGRFLFSVPVARRIAGIREAIEHIDEIKHRRLFKVLLAPVAVSASNVVISGKGRRYKVNWESKQTKAEDIIPLFDDAFVQAIYDIQRYKNRDFLGYNLLRGDARQLTPTAGEFDVAIFSPPYPNSFDYTDVYNVELWVCGYLSSGIDNRQLRLDTLRSHVQIKRSYSTGTIPSPTLEMVQCDLEHVRLKLWNKSIPDMVTAYFADMQEILRRLRTSLVVGGRAYLVVGDSRYEGVQIPVADVLSEIASDLGFRKLAIEPFRSMRASPQQGGRPELLETLLTLELG